MSDLCFPSADFISSKMFFTWTNHFLLSQQADITSFYLIYLFIYFWLNFFIVDPTPILNIDSDMYILNVWF